jgi:hypothetical protein
MIGPVHSCALYVKDSEILIKRKDRTVNTLPNDKPFEVSVVIISYIERVAYC